MTRLRFLLFRPVLTLPALADNLGFTAEITSEPNPNFYMGLFSVDDTVSSASKNLELFGNRYGRAYLEAGTYRITLSAAAFYTPSQYETPSADPNMTIGIGLMSEFGTILDAPEPASWLLVIASLFAALNLPRHRFRR